MHKSRPTLSTTDRANILAMFAAAIVIGVLIGLIRAAQMTPARVGPNYPTPFVAVTQAPETTQAPVLAVHLPTTSTRPSVALCADVTPISVPTTTTTTTTTVPPTDSLSATPTTTTAPATTTPTTTVRPAPRTATVPPATTSKKSCGR